MSWHRVGMTVPALTKEEARALRLFGWNTRCNRCGTYGARWYGGQRPGWGALALCEPCAVNLAHAQRLARTVLEAARRVNFEQDRPGTEGAA